MTILVGGLAIFVLRIVDVSLGTLRIAMLIRGRRLLAGLFGFLESGVWLIAASMVLGHLETPTQFVAYAGGYASGTMLGSTIERWLAIGDALVRIVSPLGTVNVANALRQHGFYVTAVNAEGSEGAVTVSLSVLPRKKIKMLLDLIHRTSPDSFITIEETTHIRLATIPAIRVRK